MATFQINVTSNIQGTKAEIIQALRQIETKGSDATRSMNSLVNVLNKGAAGKFSSELNSVQGKLSSLTRESERLTANFANLYAAQSIVGVNNQLQGMATQIREIGKEANETKVNLINLSEELQFKPGQELSDYFAGANKEADIFLGKIDKVADKLGLLSRQDVRLSAKQFAAAGVNPNLALAGSELSSKLAISTGEDKSGKAFADTLAGYLGALNLKNPKTQADQDKVSQSLRQVGAALKTVMDEVKAAPEDVASGMSKVFANAKPVELSDQGLAELSALFVQASATGLSPSRVGVDIQNMRNLLTNPNSKVTKGMDAIGASPDEVRKVVTEQGILPAMKLLYEQVGNNSDLIEVLEDDVLGGQRNARELTNLMKDSIVKGSKGEEKFKELVSKLGDFDRGNKLLDDAVSRRQNSDSGKLQSVESTIANIVEGLGETLNRGISAALVVLTPFTAAAQAIYGLFQKLPDPLKNFIQTIGGLGMVLTLVVGSLAGLAFGAYTLKHAWTMLKQEWESHKVAQRETVRLMERQNVLLEAANRLKAAETEAIRSRLNLNQEKDARVKDIQNAAKNDPTVRLNGDLPATMTQSKEVPDKLKARYANYERELEAITTEMAATHNSLLKVSEDRVAIEAAINTNQENIRRNALDRDDNLSQAKELSAKLDSKKISAEERAAISATIEQKMKMVETLDKEAKVFGDAAAELQANFNRVAETEKILGNSFKATRERAESLKESMETLANGLRQAEEAANKNKAAKTREANRAERENMEAILERNRKARQEEIDLRNKRSTPRLPPANDGGVSAKDLPLYMDAIRRKEGVGYDAFTDDMRNRSQANQGAVYNKSVAADIAPWVKKARDLEQALLETSKSLSETGNMGTDMGILRKYIAEQRAALRKVNQKIQQTRVSMIPTEETYEALAMIEEFNRSYAAGMSTIKEIHQKVNPKLGSSVSAASSAAQDLANQSALERRQRKAEEAAINNEYALKVKSANERLVQAKESEEAAKKKARLDEQQRRYMEDIEYRNQMEARARDEYLARYGSSIVSQRKREDIGEFGLDQDYLKSFDEPATALSRTRDNVARFAGTVIGGVNAFAMMWMTLSESMQESVQKSMAAGLNARQALVKAFEEGIARDKAASDMVEEKMAAIQAQGLKRYSKGMMTRIINSPKVRKALDELSTFAIGAMLPPGAGDAEMQGIRQIKAAIKGTMDIARNRPTLEAAAVRGYPKVVVQDVATVSKDYYKLGQNTRKAVDTTIDTLAVRLPQKIAQANEATKAKVSEIQQNVLGGFESMRASGLVVYRTFDDLRREAGLTGMSVREFADRLEMTRIVFGDMANAAKMSPEGFAAMNQALKLMRSEMGNTAKSIGDANSRWDAGMKRLSRQMDEELDKMVAEISFYNATQEAKRMNEDMARYFAAMRNDATMTGKLMEAMMGDAFRRAAREAYGQNVAMLPPGAPVRGALPAANPENVKMSDPNTRRKSGQPYVAEVHGVSSMVIDVLATEMPKVQSGFREWSKKVSTAVATALDPEDLRNYMAKSARPEIAKTMASLGQEVSEGAADIRSKAPKVKSALKEVSDAINGFTSGLKSGFKGTGKSVGAGRFDAFLSYVPGVDEMMTGINAAGGFKKAPKGAGFGTKLSTYAGNAGVLAAGAGAGLGVAALGVGALWSVDKIGQAAVAGGTMFMETLKASPVWAQVGGVFGDAAGAKNKKDELKQQKAIELLNSESFRAIYSNLGNVRQTGSRESALDAKRLYDRFMDSFGSELGDTDVVKSLGARVNSTVAGDKSANDVTQQGINQRSDDAIQRAELSLAEYKKQAAIVAKEMELKSLYQLVDPQDQLNSLKETYELAIGVEESYNARRLSGGSVTDAQMLAAKESRIDAEIAYKKAADENYKKYNLEKLAVMEAAESRFITSVQLQKEAAFQKNAILLKKGQIDEEQAIRSNLSLEQSTLEQRFLSDQRLAKQRIKVAKDAYQVAATGSQEEKLAHESLKTAKQELINLTTRYGIEAESAFERAKEEAIAYAGSMIELKSIQGSISELGAINGKIDLAKQDSSVRGKLEVARLLEERQNLIKEQELFALEQRSKSMSQSEFAEAQLEITKRYGKNNLSTQKEIYAQEQALLEAAYQDKLTTIERFEQEVSILNKQREQESNLIESSLGRQSSVIDSTNNLAQKMTEGEQTPAKVRALQTLNKMLAEYGIQSLTIGMSEEARAQRLNQLEYLKLQLKEKQLLLIQKQAEQEAQVAQVAALFSAAKAKASIDSGTLDKAELVKAQLDLKIAGLEFKAAQTQSAIKLSSIESELALLRVEKAANPISQESKNQIDQSVNQQTKSEVTKNAKSPKLDVNNPEKQLETMIKSMGLDSMGSILGKLPAQNTELITGITALKEFVKTGNASQDSLKAVQQNMYSELKLQTGYLKGIEQIMRNTNAPARPT